MGECVVGLADSWHQHIPSAELAFMGIMVACFGESCGAAKEQDLANKGGTCKPD